MLNCLDSIDLMNHKLLFFFFLGYLKWEWEKHCSSLFKGIGRHSLLANATTETFSFSLDLTERGPWPGDRWPLGVVMRESVGPGPVILGASVEAAYMWTILKAIMEAEWEYPRTNALKKSSSHHKKTIECIHIWFSTKPPNLSYPWKYIENLDILLKAIL